MVGKICARRVALEERDGRKTFTCKTKTWRREAGAGKGGRPWDTRLQFDTRRQYFCRALASEGTRFVPETGIYYSASGTGVASSAIQDYEEGFASPVDVIAHSIVARLKDSERVRKRLSGTFSLVQQFYPERPDLVQEATTMPQC